MSTLFRSCLSFLFVWGITCFSVTQVWAQNIAVFQFSSSSALEDGVQGMLAGLADRGYAEGGGVTVTRFNADGDFTVVDALSAEIVNGNFDIILTSSTLALQGIAAANVDAKIPHVFAVVTSPVAANVGVGEDPLDHPAYMTGLGTLQPFASSFELAQTLYPALKKVGIAWNPTEASSILSTEAADETALTLGIELVKVEVSAVGEVVDAFATLVSQGVEAIWIGADNTVIADADSVITVANNSGIPVFSVIPGLVDSGSLFDIGPDYYAVGVRAGSLAADILDGSDPAAIPVEAYSPEELLLNKTVLDELRDPWLFSDDVLARAKRIVGASAVAKWRGYK